MTISTLLAKIAPRVEVRSSRPRAVLLVALLAFVAAQAAETNIASFPRNGRIAFVRFSTRGDPQLYVIRSDGTHSGLFARPRGVFGYFAPAWSRDGRRIAVTSDGDRAQWISVFRSDGTGVRDVTSVSGLYKGDDDEPTWSPSGHEIAYSSFGEFNALSDAIFRIHLSDIPLRGQLSPRGGRIFAGIERPVERAARSSTYPFSEQQPAWSHDGHWIAFTRWRGEANHHLRSGGWIVLIHPDGTAIRLLTPGENPDWSPDDTRLVYDHLDHIYEINTDGGRPTQLTTATTQDFDPAWSPDGKFILFSRTRPASSNKRALVDLWLMNSGGGNAHRIARDAQQASWQPLPSQ